MGILYNKIKPLFEAFTRIFCTRSGLLEHIRQSILSAPQYSDPKRLERFGGRVYSQNDEDGIIHEIFRRIGTTNKVFVEFGIQDGLESNGHALLLQDWHGLWLEGSAEYAAQACGIFEKAVKSGRLLIKNAWIDKDNIDDLIRSIDGHWGINLEKDPSIDLLSIDIDGNDYDVMDNITVIRPRVIVAEYNAKLSYYINWHMEYNPQHTWDGSDRQGVSLLAWHELLKRKGYRLAGTSLSGINAFFVREDLAGDLFPEPADPEHLYNPFRMGLYPVNGHPARHYLGRD